MEMPIGSSFTINVTNVNDAPTISNLNGTSISYKDGDSAISVTSGASAAVVVADMTRPILMEAL